VPGASCVSGTWKDTAAPVTTINPNGGDFTGYNVTSFTLSCADTGGSGCDKSYYKVINDGEVCGATGFTDGTSAQMTCPFGQVCNKRVCFYSTDRAANIEATKMSGIFHLDTNACQGRVCGQTCLYISGICPGPSLPCYTNGGCLLNCNVPPPGTGNERIWNVSNCGRTGVYKCGLNSVCNASLTSCTAGGGSSQVTGNWASYTYPSGSYGAGGVFQVSLSGVTRNPSGFTILSECAVVKSNGSVIYFDNWGTDAAFSYAIKPNDPEGTWKVDYCGLWSDFEPNGGWQLKMNNTDYQFTVDKSPPVIIINNPQQGGMYSSDFLVGATVTDAYSSVDKVFYRWQNATNNGTWVGMAKSGNDYTANFPVALVSDGVYSIKVRANDSVSNAEEAVVTNILIDREPPKITMLNPSTGWYRTDFSVVARVTDNQGVSNVIYRWENLSNVGPWNAMTYLNGNYTAAFAVASVSPGNYTIRVWANDSFGNNGNKSASNVGIDYIYPISWMTSPSPTGPGMFVMSKNFNISWTGSDAHSGLKCYYIKYRYCNNNNGQCPDDVCSINFADDYCTKTAPPYEFDPSMQSCLLGISDLNNYTFFFKSIAVDNAGNVESDAKQEANVTVYIPKLISFSTMENTTKFSVRSGGKVPTGREVIISASALPGVNEDLNITIYYANHTVGKLPSGWMHVSCTHVKQCNAAISVNVTEAEGVQEVDYYIWAQNSSMTEYLPPNAPSGYFNYFVYNHPICNFLVIDEYRTILGSNDLVALEIRNIHDQFDNVTLTLAPNFGRFVETDSTSLNVVLNPSEEKIIYARLVPSMDGFQLTLTGTSEVDTGFVDEDYITVRVDMPPNFSEFGDSAAFALVMLAGLVYFVFLAKK
jgi:hypothetical protein